MWGCCDFLARGRLSFASGAQTLVFLGSTLTFIWMT